MFYYSASTKGFYSPDIHGARLRLVPDPSWVPDSESPEAAAPMISQANPDCSMPVDVMELSAENYAAMLEAQTAGQQIVPGADGLPVAVDGLQPDPEVAALAFVDSLLEDAARSHGYGSILSAVSYASQREGARFQAEGAAFLEWRTAVYDKALTVLAGVKAGSSPMPTNDEIRALMPALTLPG